MTEGSLLYILMMLNVGLILAEAVLLRKTSRSRRELETLTKELQISTAQAVQDAMVFRALRGHMEYLLGLLPYAKHYTR